MSIEAMIWVRKHAPTKNSAEMCILYALADRANDDGSGCWPYYETLADEARVSLPTVKRHIKNLEERGLIIRGNQALVASYPKYRKPVVWNLNMKLRREVKNPEEKAGDHIDTAQEWGINDDKVGYQNEQTEVSVSTDCGVTVDTDNPPTTPLQPSINPPAPQGGAAETSQQIELAQPKTKSVSKKGTRITPDWMPSQPVIDKMQAQFPDMDFFAVHEEFIDYWLGVPGQRGVKLDWDATWRNSIRRSGNRGDYPRVKGHVPTSRSGGGHSKADSKALWYAQKAEELARKYAGGDPGAY